MWMKNIKMTVLLVCCAILALYFIIGAPLAAVVVLAAASTETPCWPCCTALPCNCAGAMVFDCQGMTRNPRCGSACRDGLRVQPQILPTRGAVRRGGADWVVTRITVRLRRSTGLPRSM